MTPSAINFILALTVAYFTGLGTAVLWIGLIHGGSGPVRDPQEDDYPHEHVEDYR
jgi:hypothetical protein